jgi:hypothetical protein
MKYSELFSVRPGSEVRLNKINPDYTAKHTKRKSAVKQVEKLDRKLRELHPNEQQMVPESRRCEHRRGDTRVARHEVPRSDR